MDQPGATGVAPYAGGAGVDQPGGGGGGVDQPGGGGGACGACGVGVDQPGAGGTCGSTFVGPPPSWVVLASGTTVGAGGTGSVGRAAQVVAPGSSDGSGSGQPGASPS
ncbi:MAG: hypothetical protein U0R76_16400 [Candidatus Nanopelagicales bacterium]